MLERTAEVIEGIDDNAVIDYIPRHLLQCRDSSGERLPTATPIDLTEPVRSYFRKIPANSAGGFLCVDVAAFAGDGVTTACTQIGDAIDREFGRVRTKHVRLDDFKKAPSTLGPPAIFKAFKSRTILRCARAAGIRRAILPPLALKASVLAVGVGLTVAGAILASEQGLATIVVGAIVNVAAQLVLNFLPGGSRRSVMERIIDVCATASDQRTRFVEALSDEFASWRGVRCVVVDTFGAQDETTRAVLCDYLQRHTSKERPELWVVFDHREFARSGRRGDRRAGTTAFRRELTGLSQEWRKDHRTEPFPYGFGRVHYYELTQLSASDRRRLAISARHPERAGLTTVNAIMADGPGGLAEYFDELLPGPGRAYPETLQAAQLLYLLSLDSVRDAIEWPAKKLTRRLELAEGTRRIVLTRVLGMPRLERSRTVKRRIDRMLQDFEKVVVASADDRGTVFSVSTAVADELAGTDGEQGSWAERGLVAPSLGHMFWALYRYRREETFGSLYWADVLHAHLVRAVPLSDSADTNAADEFLISEPEVVHDLRGAFDTALTNAINLGRSVGVVDLLRSARRNARFSADKAGDLWAKARDVYAVGLDPDVLRLLFGLVDDEAALPAVEATGSSLLILYAQAHDAVPLQGDGPAAVSGGLPLPLRLDLEIRGLWFALSLQPFVPDLAASLHRALIVAHLDTGPAARAIITASRENPATTKTVADWASVSMAIWCWAVSGEPGRRAAAASVIHQTVAEEVAAHLTPEKMLTALGRPVDASDGPFELTIESLLLLADETPGLERHTAWLRASIGPDIARALRDALNIGRLLQRGGGNAGVSYLRDGMAEEILAVTAAASIYVLARWEVTDDVRHRIRETLDRCLRSLDIATVPDLNVGSLATAASAVVDRLRLLQLTWKTLGYEALAASINVRRAQFEAETLSRWRPTSGAAPAVLPVQRRARDARAAEAMERSLVDDRDRRDMLGLIANLAAAEDTRIGANAGRGDVLVGEILLAAMSVQLDEEEFADELMTDLCITALSHTHAHSDAPIAGIMAYLLRSDGDESPQPRLAAWLRSVDDTSIGTAANWLANASRRPGVNRHRVRELLDERLSLIADETARDVAISYIEIGDLTDQIRRDAVVVDDVLDSWHHRRQRAIYAYVLSLLLPADPTAPLDTRLAQEAIDVVTRMSEYLGSNGSALLAIDMALRWSARSNDLDRAEAPMDADTLIAALKRSLQQWASRLEIPAAIRGLFLLRRLDRQNEAQYTQQLAALSEQQLLALEQREITSLGQTRRYAVLLLAYARICRTWGLVPIRSSAPQLVAPPGTSGWEAQSRRLLEATPMVLVRRDDHIYVSGQFLDDVEALFETDRAFDTAFGAARDHFDVAARKSLPRVLNLLADLKGMPVRIHQILLQHRAKVLELEGGHNVDPAVA